MDSVVLGRRKVGVDELVGHICNDQVRRWRAGQRVPVEAYLSLHPPIRDDPSAMFELIYGEFLVREELGEAPSLEEFRWRFPPFEERLQRQLALHDVLLTPDPVSSQATEATIYGAGRTDEGGDRAGRFIAPGYRILGELGRGGMGAVYKAWQVRLKRVVAVKVIRADAYADTAAAARFQAEAEAAARFQHPNIVPVFEVGEYERMGYLVLEYVAGGGLDRRLAGQLQDPRESARLIETLARAIHYAHQRGIVHRDLKPANVLLTEDNVPKIADFGLAKLLERDQSLTGAGEILGTPSYMAPEQVRGIPDQVTPATDVYSLGAILYEALTGRPPFKGTTPLSTLEQVATSEPLAPGKLQRHLPRDLETICLKCLAKEPHRRYPTALSLAEDLERYLTSQPILARPTPAWERAWKWARRRPSVALALGALVLALQLLLGGGLYYHVRLRDEMRASRAAERIAGESAKAATHQANLALTALNQLVFEVQEKLAQTPATRSLRQSLLNTAITGLNEIGRSAFGTAPDLSQAVAHQKLGDIFRIIGQPVPARRHFEESRRLADQLLATVPAKKSSIEEALYQTQMGLGLLDIFAERYDHAKLELERAVAMAESIAANKPNSEEARRNLIEAYLQLGRAYSFALEYASAEMWFRRMRDLAERWVAQEPSHRPARDLLASSYRKLGDLKKFSRDFAAARTDYEKAIDIVRDLVAAEPTNFEFKTHLAIALDDLAGVAKSQGRFDQSRTLFTEAEQHFAALAGSDPDRLDSQLALLHTQLHIATLEKDASRFAAAADRFRAVRDGLAKLDREGRLVIQRTLFTSQRALATEIAFCEAAPHALRSPEAALSQPPVVAARLLLSSASALSDAEAPRRIGTISESMIGLSAEDPEDLLDLARSLVSLMSDFDAGRWPGVRPEERLNWRKRCADRAVEMLRQAIERGLDDPGRLQGPELERLAGHPGYRELLARWSKRPHSPRGAVRSSE
jgi:tetratricopeptide (TPR) repeat protein